MTQATTEAIPSKTAKLVRERDGQRCRKCPTTRRLQVHHIVPRSEGGTNEPDNLLLLCANCHKEWHKIGGRSPHSFEEWLTLPPQDALTMLYALQMPDDFPANQMTDVVKEAWRMWRELNKTMPFTEDADGNPIWL